VQSPNDRPGRRSSTTADHINVPRLRLEKFVLDEASRVHRHPDLGDFPYSDGPAVERRLLQILTEARDVSMMSAELVAKISDWPTEYHLSPRRHLLLRHLDALDGARILELGAGCGAITRFLGERGADVTAVEGSLIRAHCARQRCRDLAQVRVYCSDFASVEFEAEYDVVTLIGVLEYSPAYFTSAQPLLDCLTLARDALTPNGRLVIAIENQLGLKYFCGFPEDHLSRQFAGLEDLYPPASVRTVGRAHLSRLLQQAGFPSVTFHYPFPDYKLPRFVLTEEAFTCSAFAPGEILQQFGSRDYSGRHSELIDERSVWPVLDRNGLIPDLANSFLVVARRSPSPPPPPARPILLATGYTDNRAAPYNVVTSFWHDAGQVLVRKAPLTPPPPAGGATDPPRAVLVHRLGEEPYIPGRHFESELRRAVRADDLEGYRKGLRTWLRFVYDHGIVELDAHEPSRSPVKPDFIDCIPRNLIQGPHGLTLIDREWEYRGRFSVAVLLLRHFEQAHDDPVFRGFLCRHFPERRGILVALLENVGVPIDDATVGEFVEVSNEIRRLVFPWAAPLTVAKVDSWLRLPPSSGKPSPARRALRKGFKLLRSSARRARRLWPDPG
jgi:SAM-dependent methyltransferase